MRHCLPWPVNTSLSFVTGLLWPCLPPYINWVSIYFVPIKLPSDHMEMCYILNNTETVPCTVTLCMYEDVTDQTRICMNLPDRIKSTHEESLARIQIKVCEYSGNLTKMKTYKLPTSWFEPATPISAGRHSFHWTTHAVVIVVVKNT